MLKLFSKLDKHIRSIHPIPLQISVVTAPLRAAAPQRVRAEGQGPGVLPQGQLQGDVPHHRELPVLRGQPPQAPGTPFSAAVLRFTLVTT